MNTKSVSDRTISLKSETDTMWNELEETAVKFAKDAEDEIYLLLSIFAGQIFDPRGFQVAVLF